MNTFKGARLSHYLGTKAFPALGNQSWRLQGGKVFENTETNTDTINSSSTCWHSSSTSSLTYSEWIFKEKHSKPSSITIAPVLICSQVSAFCHVNSDKILSTLRALGLEESTQNLWTAPKGECCYKSYSKHLPASSHGLKLSTKGWQSQAFLSWSNQHFSASVSRTWHPAGGQWGAERPESTPSTACASQCWVGLSAELDHVRIQIHPCLPRSTSFCWLGSWRLLHALTPWGPEKTDWRTARASPGSVTVTVGTAALPFWPRTRGCGF